MDKEGQWLDRNQMRLISHEEMSLTWHKTWAEWEIWCNCMIRPFLIKMKIINRIRGKNQPIRESRGSSEKKNEHCQQKCTLHNQNLENNHFLNNIWWIMVAMMLIVKRRQVLRKIYLRHQRTLKSGVIHTLVRILNKSIVTFIWRICSKCNKLHLNANLRMTWMLECWRRWITKFCGMILVRVETTSLLRRINHWTLVRAWLCKKDTGST